MALISLVPARTWIAEPWPPVLNLANYAQLADREHLRPIVNSLWMAAAATVAATALGLGAALAAVPTLAGGNGRGGRRAGRLGGLLETLVGLPSAIPRTAFAIALATTFSVDAPPVDRAPA